MSIILPTATAWLSYHSKYFSDPLIIWMTLIISLLIAVWLTVGIKKILNKKINIKLEEIIKKNFCNETVTLDGKKFISCKFDNCTIKYNGGDFILDNSDMSENCRIKLATKQSIATLHLIYGFLALNPAKNLIVLDQYNIVIEYSKIIVK